MNSIDWKTNHACPLGMLSLQAQVSQQHQVALVAYHLRLAAKYGRPISMHCVRATGPLQDLLTSTPSDQLPQRIMVHSFGGPPDSVKQVGGTCEEVTSLYHGHFVASQVRMYAFHTVMWQFVLKRGVGQHRWGGKVGSA